jgi:SAM-dependent methyltransferase
LGGASPVSGSPSWKGKLRRALAAPFRFLLKEELGAVQRLEARVGEVERTIAGAREALERETQERMTLQQQQQRALEDLRNAYLATRGEFEEVRDRRVPQLAQDLAGLQAGLAALQQELELLRDARIPQLEQAQGRLQGAFEELQRELVGLRDQRMAELEQAQGRLQGAFEELQREMERLRDVGLPQVEERLAALHRALQEVQALAEEVRDQRLPAAAARLDALVARLFEELSTCRGLLDRMLFREPLAVPRLSPGQEQRLPEAVQRAWLRFLDSQRGRREEILERARIYVDLFAQAQPVLDLGCGRGELLQALGEAGIRAFGVDADPAAVAACRELGFAAEVQDALEALRSRETGSLGGVAAVHLVEHLPTATWMQLFAEAARVLRPGGLLAVESPNPESLRVGASLFWVDPTHLRPVHPEAARFVAEAVGLEVLEIRKLRPFPREQWLAPRAAEPSLQELLAMLDDWLSGPRDFLLIARKPDAV